MDDSAIFAAGVVKRYRRTVAVQQFDLSLRRGEVCGLVGPNGAGKSSVIRMLLGLIKPTRGRLLVDCLNPSSHSFTVRRRVGYVPEQHHIYPWMRVPRVLKFAASVYPTWDRGECGRLTERLGIPMKRRVQELSRGELAKLALTIALSHRPSILILDEPTSGLDPLVRRDFVDLLRELLAARNCSVLFSTHILTDVEKLADRIVVMHQGFVRINEPVETLRARYLEASLLFKVPPTNHAVVPEAIRVERSLREWLALFPASSGPRIRQIASEIGADDCMIQPATLETVFPELIAPAREVKA
jgi:ABC-2 type transport system ATP-binding protein